MTQAGLARAAGMSAGAIGNYEAGTREQPREVFKLALALDVDAEWLAKGVGDQAPRTPRVTGAGKALAHLLSHARNTESLPRLKWEELMSADLSRPFELEVVDNALGDDIVIGCVARFHPAGSRQPQPGRPVLVRDLDGNHYLRDYEQGPGKRWRAVARKTGFLPMDSEEFGLVVVAVMKGVDYP